MYIHYKVSLHPHLQQLRENEISYGLKMYINTVDVIFNKS